MKTLEVHYVGWGEDWLLGRLADDGRQLLFEYAPEALAQGLELSPLLLKLRRPAYSRFPAWQYGLPGLIADALPDGWGLLLMDRVFRQLGVERPSALDRLAFVGARAMGALRFVPAQATAADPDWTLLALAEHSARLARSQSTSTARGDAKVVLGALAVLGGSPQGARPKAQVQYDPATQQFSTRSDGPGEPWLIKFPAAREHIEVCAIERLYAELAHDCGIDMPPSALFEISPKLAAFGVARFDRVQGMRVPIHSLAGLLGIDFRLPGAVDYLGYLRATRALTRDQREVEQAFARAVYNALFHNRDDHPKNFAYRLGPDRRWRLTPAFDLSFADGPGGQHHLDYAGVGTHISGAHLRQLADAAGLERRAADACIERMLTVAAGFAERASQWPIRRATVQKLAKAIARCRAAIADP